MAEEVIDVSLEAHAKSLLSLSTDLTYTTLAKKKLYTCFLSLKSSYFQTAFLTVPDDH